METNKDASEKRVFLGLPISETILLAASPLLAYVFTFVYQAGYFDTFKLPYQFISVNLTDVLNIGGRVLGVFIFVLGVINFLSTILPKSIYHYPSLERRMSHLLLLFLLVVPFCLVSGMGEMRVVIFREWRHWTDKL
jgi:predicted MFS family arabinose efflux permease